MSAVQRTGQRPWQNNSSRNNNMQYRTQKNYIKKSPVGQGVKIATGPQPQREAMIARNLLHMKQVAQKKRLAQEMYYGNGRSPMVKHTNTYVKQEHNGRLSVQQRLGNARANITPNIINKFNNNPNKFNNNPNKFNNNPNKFNNNPNKFNNHPNKFNNNPNKPAYINRNNNNAKYVGGLRSDKILRVQNFQQKKVFRNNSGTIKTVNAAGKVVYLKPVRRPANLSVRVENDRKHHVQKDLNPLLQQEIKLIQSKNMRQVMGPVPVAVPAHPPSVSFDSIEKLPICATTRTLHERFSMI